MISIMKKITLLVASIFLFGGGITNATANNTFSQERIWPVDFRNADPIVFMERGVEFFIFPDGQFDFNTRPSGGKINYKPNGRRMVNRTYGAPMNSRIQNYGVKVEHDDFGRVRRIGNVFINYDANDRIKRVGSVYMSYNRFALEQVGGLQIIYNRRGQIVDMVGSVKGRDGYEMVQNARYETDYDQRNPRGNYDTPTRIDENTNDQDQYYFKNSTSNTKTNDAKVTGSLDVRINNR